jgi:SPX domain protein involved in polyphosphate accumulation
MKVMLYSAVEQLPNFDDSNQSNDVNTYVKQFDEQFLSYCEQELNKINTFFAEKLAEAIRKFGDLKSELNSSLKFSENGINNKKLLKTIS